MARKTTSRTERESYLEDRLFGGNGHHKTTITDTDKKAVGRGRTPEESQKVASDRWRETKKK